MYNKKDSPQPREVTSSLPIGEHTGEHTGMWLNCFSSTLAKRDSIFPRLLIIALKAGGRDLERERGTSITAVTAVTGG